MLSSIAGGSGPDFGGIDNDLAFKPRFVLSDQFLHLLKPHGENDRVGSSDRALHRVGASEGPELLCERFGRRLVPRG
jgi:hypothetical protein